MLQILDESAYISTDARLPLDWHKFEIQEHGKAFQIYRAIITKRVLYSAMFHSKCPRYLHITITFDQLELKYSCNTHMKEIFML